MIVDSMQNDWQPDTMPNEPTTRVFSTRLSIDQYDLITTILNADGESAADYIRRLVAEDMRRRGVAWPEYEVVKNEDRAARGIKGRGKL